jgi:cyclic pyranopterin phosphate synthase
MSLIDAHGRRLRKLRVQLTDACNFRCFYCMPEGTRFQPAEHLLSPDEIGDIGGALATLGIEEARVTGGEPTVRPEFDAIMARLAGIGWKKFGLTTNGYLLSGKLPLLKELGCRHLNVSLDSLDEERFRAITGSGYFRKVHAAILQAKSMGFEVKINAIVFRGINDDELSAFARFSAEHGIEVRFLELMRVGPAIGGHGARFIPAGEMIGRLRESEEMLPVDSAPDSTSFGFRTARGGRLGFIASESQPFCGSCSRLRLSATGKLRSCLFSDTGVELRGRDRLDYPEILREVMALKPAGRLPRIPQPMNQIGG